MKAIDGLLPVDKTYKLISVDYSHIDDDNYLPTECDNCKKMITKKVSIGSDNGINIVGTDCAVALLSIKKPMIEYQINKNIRDEMKFKKYIHTECKTAVIDVKEDTIYLYSEVVEQWSRKYKYRAKGKYSECLPSTIKKIYQN